MDFVWVLIAFIFGVAFKQIGLPPLVGYLLAGFTLNAAGFVPHEGLQLLADLGITLMLFTIGLKLNIRSLASPEILLGATSHCLIWCLFVVGKWLVLGALGFGMVSVLDISWQSALLVAFALSFSSTVGVIKMLEDQDELKTRHGRVAIGVLIIQDVIAVLFLAVSLGKVPTIGALSLLLLIPARPLIYKLLDRGGHGELLPLSGFFLALGGAELFSFFNVKADLGALLLGVLLAGSPKATELYKSLISFKDLFLIAFFLSIGFAALPSLEMLLVALGISLLLVAKFIMFMLLFLFFKMRPRNAFLCAVTLSNFSEFGLIVTNVAVAQSWLSGDWLVVIALAVTSSLIISSIVSRYSHRLYARYKDDICRLQGGKGAPAYEFEQPAAVHTLLIGMGRVGSGTYDSFEESYPGCVLGVDADEDRLNEHEQAGRQVVLGDGEDIDFWEQLDLSKISLIMLAPPGIFELKAMIAMIRERGYQGNIACITRFEDERQQLLSIGADAVFNYFSEVGAGFAEEGKKLLADRT